MKKIFTARTVYPAITIIFILIVAVLFINTAKFFSTKINDAFLVDANQANSGVIKLNIEKYKALTPRLGIQSAF